MRPRTVHGARGGTDRPPRIQLRRPRGAVRGGLAGLVGLTTLAGLLVVGQGPASAGVIQAVDATAIPGRYIVMLADQPGLTATAVADRAAPLVRAHHGTVRQLWTGLHGFSVAMDEADAARLAKEPGVASVFADGTVSMGTTTPAAGGARTNAAQTPVSWGLDRVDQHKQPLDNRYAYDDSAGEGVTVYQLDTGIELNHPDLKPRAFLGKDLVDDDQPPGTDCTGEGTALAGVVAGTEFGVAKKVKIVSVRVFNCDNKSSKEAYLSGLNFVATTAGPKSVLLISLNDLCKGPDGTIGPCDPALREAIIAAEQKVLNNGVSVVANAGDNGADACQRSSGVAPGGFYVGATTSIDAMWPQSNWGSCVSMFAPGMDIPTDAPSGMDVISSTALSAAFVAGTVALFAGKPEFAGATPAKIRTELVTNRSTKDVITGLGTGSPNLLLFTGPPGFFTIGDSIGLAPAGNGLLELFGVTPDSKLAWRGQNQDGSWGAWATSTNKGYQSIGAEANADGRTQLAALTPTGDLYQRQQLTANTNTWLNWRSVGQAGDHHVALARNLNNRLNIVTTNAAGIPTYRVQSTPGAETFSSALQFAVNAPRVHAITAASNHDGRIEVLAVDEAGQVWRTANQTPMSDTQWTPFTKLAGFGVSSIAVARNNDGRLELVGIDNGGNVYRRAQTTANAAAWTDWAPLPQKTLSNLAAERDTSGRVVVVGVDNLGKIWQTSQTGAGATTYAPWVQIDGTLRA